MQAYITTVFFSGLAEVRQFLDQLKLKRCPHCRRAGFLIRNGRAYGYAATGSAQVIRAQRILCSNRHRRQGCGRTVRLVLATLLHGSMVSALTLWAFFCHKLHATPAPTPSCGAHWWRRLRAAQSYLRGLLSRIRPPPSAEPGSDPIRETLRHLEAAFASDPCPIAAFQLHFQKPFFPR